MLRTDATHLADIKMIDGISHDREEETLEAKVRWFQSLSLQERMELLCSFTDMILEINPEIVRQKDAKPIAGRVCVLEKISG